MQQTMIRDGGAAEHAPRMVRANGVALRTQAFGDPKDPCVLLIHGANAPMMRWPEDFCLRIAGAGRFVIRFDNRDTGASSVFPAGAPGYDLRDLAKDAVGVLDAYGVLAAHVAGFSMGGMICQHLAIFHPDRVLSAMLGATTPDPSAVTAASGRGADSGALPPPPAKILAHLAYLATVDWRDPAQAHAAWMREEAVLLGSGDMPDVEATRQIIDRVVAEAGDLASHRLNHPLAVTHTPPWRTRLKDIRVPTLVFHGTEDGCLPLPHGVALAREVPGARLQVVEGMGHILAPGSRYWDQTAAAIIDHTAGRGQ